MNHAVELEVKCEDFLRNNPHLYARKAKRKKIALIGVEAANRSSADIRIELGASKLVAGDQSYGVESPDVIIRRFSEFTWDFMVYSILDFHPLLAVVDAAFFLSGPLYNRRLRKQLHLLSAAEMVVRPGESKKAILGFRGLSKTPTQLRLLCRLDAGERLEVACVIR
jgi:hypothetical protein